MKKINIFSIVYFSFSILLLTYIFYKSEIVAKGLKHDYYINFYYIALFLIIFSILTIFLKRDFNIKIFTSVFSIIFSFYLVEFFLTSKQLISKKIFNNEIFINEFKKENPSVVPIIFLGKFLGKEKEKIFPLSGISNKNTNLGNENGYYAIYKSDRYGFNNPDKLWDEENIEYTLIGDSFVHGMSVFDKDSFRGNIEKISQAGVINLGYSGNGPLIELATLREYFPKKNVKKVIWFYYEENDISDLVNEKANRILIKYLESPNYSQNLINKQKKLDNILINHLREEVKLQKFKVFKILKDFIKFSQTRAFLNKNFRYKKDIYQITEDFWKIIALAKSFVEDNGAEFYFVYIPDKHRYIHNLENDFNFRHYSEILKKIKEMDIKLIDLNREFLSITDKPLELYAPDSFHFNENGYALGSKIIIKNIN